MQQLKWFGAVMALLIHPALFAAGLQWQTQAAMPLAVQEIYPAAHNGKIYVAGGLSDALPAAQHQMTDAVQVYDPANNSWTPGPVLPQPRHHAYLVSVQQQLFLFGGFIYANGGRWSASSDVLLLDEAAGVWRQIAQLPKPLTETVAVVLDNKIHFVSGRSTHGDANAQWNDQTDVNWHWVFDPVTLSFTDSVAVATAHNSATGVVLNNQLYLLGGRVVNGSNLADLQRFDTDTGTWQQLAPLPQAQGGLAAAVLDNSILVFGGEYFTNGGGVYSEVWQYLPAQDNWQQLGTMPVPRHGLGAVALGSKIYVVGGAAEVGLKATSAVLEAISLPVSDSKR